MNQFNQPWRKLTALARQASDLRDTGVPYGFATRVAAQAETMPAEAAWKPLEHFALRGLLLAAAFGAVAIAFNYTGTTTSTQTDAYAAADTVGELLDLS